MTTLDPYPPDLLPMETTAPATATIDTRPEPMPKPGWQPVDPMLAVLTRIAVALEQLVLENIKPAPERPTLTPLPAVQVAANKPPCPYHGPDKVASSTKPGGGWYCQAKAAPGQPQNARGYCAWQVAG